MEESPQPLCQHLCHNYVGGYFCSCRPGYELQKDRHSCQGEVRVGRKGPSKGSPGQPESPGDPPPGFALTAECSSELFTEPSGYISSLEYPRPYPPDLRCNYSIRVERGLTLQLKFLEPFEIDDHEQVHCPYDQLQVQQTSPPPDALSSPPIATWLSYPSFLLDPLANRYSNGQHHT